MADADMQITSIDPRDQRWEIDEPVYRVYFADGPKDPSRSVAIFEKRITGARSVTEVIAWADNDGREYTLWVEVPDEDYGLGLILLAGEDPNRHD